MILAATIAAATITAPSLADAMHDRIEARESPARRSCRRAPDGCRARLGAIADAFTASGAAHNIDPILLAAIAWEESRWSVDATGAQGEIGVLQVHPGSWRAARATRLYREPDLCARQTDGCQPELIAVAADLLAAAIRRCGGSVWRGIAVYHTGSPAHCTADQPGPYVRRVMRTGRGLGQVSPWS